MEKHEFNESEIQFIQEIAQNNTVLLDVLQNLIVCLKFQI